MKFVKNSGNAYPTAVSLNSTSEPITVYAVDETTGAAVSCNWHLTARDRRWASIPGSLNVPAVNGQYSAGVDPNDDARVQAQCTPVVGTSVVFYPSTESVKAQNGITVLVGVAGNQQRELIISVS
jgi:hypothetical protein